MHAIIDPTRPCKIIRKNTVGQIQIYARTVMARLELLTEYVRYKVEEEHYTHLELSAELQRLYPGERGFSLRSIERFCSNAGISKTPLNIDDKSLNDIVTEAVLKVVGYMYRHR